MNPSFRHSNASKLLEHSRYVLFVILLPRDQWYNLCFLQYLLICRIYNLGAEHLILYKVHESLPLLQSFLVFSPRYPRPLMEGLLKHVWHEVCLEILSQLKIWPLNLDAFPSLLLEFGPLFIALLYELLGVQLRCPHYTLLLGFKVVQIFLRELNPIVLDQEGFDNL